MNRSSIGRLIGAVSGIVGGVLAFVVSTAFSRSFALAAGTPTPSGGSTTTTTTTPLFTTDSAFFIFFLIILFVFGLVLIVGLLFYIYKIQIKYYSAVQSFSQMGVSVKALPVSPLVTPPPKDIASGTAPPQPHPLKIDGPGVVAVGVQAEFTATDENKNPASSAHWSIDPPDSASFSGKGEGDKVTVIPLKMGPITLTAKTTDSATAAVIEQGSSTFAAVSSQTTEELPLLGQGYGSLVIAVLVVLAVILLALTGYLTGEAVATLFGGLLGYIFGVSTTAAGAAASKKSNGKTPGGGG